jgi:hypothetical protein
MSIRSVYFLRNPENNPFGVEFYSSYEYNTQSSNESSIYVGFSQSRAFSSYAIMRLRSRNYVCSGAIVTFYCTHVFVSPSKQDDQDGGGGKIIMMVVADTLCRIAYIADPDDNSRLRLKRHLHLH